MKKIITVLTILILITGHGSLKSDESNSSETIPDYKVSSDSRIEEIVTDLLKNEMGFRGLVITDAMNMGGVRTVPNSGLKAVMAGCDQLLMPVEEEKDINDILSKLNEDEDFRFQVYASVKKIIRLKYCLGLIK
mgnify:CR=1 FL=1